MGEEILEKSSTGHDRPTREGGAEDASQREARPVLPSVSSVLQAGAFGAALGGMTAGVTEIARVKRGEITTEQAMETVVKSSAQSAATMAVASVAAQVVRSHPVFGFVTLAAAGIGAFLLLSGRNEKPRQPTSPVTTDPTAKRAPKDAAGQAEADVA